MISVHVLGRIDGVINRRRIDVIGQGGLNEYPVAGRVAVQPFDNRHDFGLRNRLGKPERGNRHADALRLPDF